MLKIAVATSDGVNIDVHFGQAKSFHLFEVAEDGTYHLIEHRRLTSREPGDPIPLHAVDATIEQLSDVDVVLSNRIGPGPTHSLEAEGIRTSALSGPVDKALTAYGKRHKLFGKRIPGVTRPEDFNIKGCGGGGCGKHGGTCGH